MPSPFQEYLDRIEEKKKAIDFFNKKLAEEEQKNDWSAANDTRKTIKQYEAEIEQIYKMMS